MANVLRLYWFEQGVPQRYIPSTQHLRASWWRVRVPGVELPGRLLWIQLDHDACSRWGENDIHHGRCQLLLQGHALWPKKCRCYILGIDRPNFQETDQTKRRGLCQRHGREVSEHSPTRGRFGRRLWRAPQIWHVPQLEKMYFRDLWSGCKFLGFMITHRGIEVNPDKCIAILEMHTPTNIQEV